MGHTIILPYIDGVLYGTELPQNISTLENINQPQSVDLMARAYFVLISVDIGAFSNYGSDQKSNVRRPEPKPGNCQAPHLILLITRVEFMITFLELVPHNSFIICRELNNCSYKR